jgi:hypothetical protein
MSENDTLRFGGFPPPEPAVPVEFRVTTYWERKRNEPGLTQVASQRIVLSEALDWVLSELPDDAITIEPDDTGGNVIIRICWDLVPAEIRYGRRS